MSFDCVSMVVMVAVDRGGGDDVAVCCDAT